MKKLLSIILLLLMIGISPVVSLAGELEDAQERVRLNPNDGGAHDYLGFTYNKLGQYEKAIASLEEAIRLKPSFFSAYRNLGISYVGLGQYQEAIAPLKEAIRLKPDDARAHASLGFAYIKLDVGWGGVAYGAVNGINVKQEAIASLKEAIRIEPDFAVAHQILGPIYEKMGRNDEAIKEYKEALRIDPDFTDTRNHLNELEQKIADERLVREQHLIEEERKKHKALQNIKEADRLARERKLLEEERERLEAFRIDDENRQRQAQAEKESPPQPPKEQSPQSGTGSGFFVSKLGHVITNAHVVKGCKRVTVGDNANKQVPAEIINTDGSNDLALLKLSSLEMASAESKSLIQKLTIEVVPLASKGLLRSEDVRRGEKVLVAGYPFGDLISNTMKFTSGIVSATLGAGDDSGRFQLDAAIQPGNSGGPIYDYGGNIVGVVVSQLNKLRMVEALGTIPENQNFGIKASTVRQFLESSGLPSKKAERTKDKSTEEVAQIAENQALMVMCLQ